jgi:hypothetical protein
MSSSLLDSISIVAPAPARSDIPVGGADDEQLLREGYLDAIEYIRGVLTDPETPSARAKHAEFCLAWLSAHALPRGDHAPFITPHRRRPSGSA